MPQDNTLNGLDALSLIGSNTGNNSSSNGISALSIPEAFANFGGPNGIAGGAIPSAAGPGGGGFDIGNFLLGGKDNAGALGLGFDFLSGIAQFGLLKDQLDLQKDQFKFQKGFANRNLTNQAKTVNNALEDRQNARLQSTGNSGVSGTQYESLNSFLDKNRLSEDKIR